MLMWLGFRFAYLHSLRGVMVIPVWKRFTCAWKGWREEKTVLNDHVKKSRKKVKLTSCGCEAMISLRRRDDGNYEVLRFVCQHTHQLVSTNKKQFTRTNREVSSELRSTFLTCHSIDEPLPKKLAYTNWDQERYPEKLVSDRDGNLSPQSSLLIGQPS